MKTKCHKCKSEYFIIDHGHLCGGCGEVCDIEAAKEKLSQMKKDVHILEGKIKRREFYIS